MTATANPLPKTMSSINLLDSSLYYTIKADTKIPAGTLAMRVAGNNYVEPYVGNTNNAILMGVAEKTYDNTGNLSALTYANSAPMVFRRGVFDQFKSDGTITAADHVMAVVYLKDNQTIGASNAGNDCACTLLAIDQREGTVYRVLIDQSGPV